MPLTFSWDTQSHAMPHHTCLKEGVCNLCRLSKVELGCFNLCTALSNPELTLFQLHAFASLWLVGSTKTMSGMFSGKPSKGKINFKTPNSVVFSNDRRKLILHANQSINQSPGTCQLKNEVAGREWKCIILFFLLVAHFLCLWWLSYNEYIKDLFCLLGDWGRWSLQIFLIFVPGSWKEKKLVGVFVLL